MTRHTRTARFITAKFPCLCDETAQEIKKGQTCLYFPEEKSVFHINSKQAKDFRREQANQNNGPVKNANRV